MGTMLVRTGHRRSDRLAAAFLFVVLFGLSMDYHVLILSRVREAHLRGMKTSDAVADGIKSTAGVVTSAAVVMVAVFSIFAILPEVVFKQLGVGLAAAVLIDATVVRAVLLASTMKLLGEWNWYLPRRRKSIGTGDVCQMRQPSRSSSAADAHIATYGETGT